ncbi:type III secretion system protein [Photobacterium damselae subsp. piscicida]|uniref:type III secretion system protein n=1 Tax=Photobacterium damselae TaxID=38293 RepID=UPI001076754C|nr:type III secretion system protein [Photobacterium damselae]TFZ48641.1 type III secretion system protein [Photobacterium damselae subsp. piscicida]
MLIRNITNSLSVMDGINNNDSIKYLLERWKLNCSSSEALDCDVFLSEIEASNETGVLSLQYLSNLSSIPYIPEKITKLEIMFCDNLEEIPQLPDTIKNITISDCPKLNISRFPKDIESISIDMSNYSGWNKSLPDIPSGLISFSAKNGSYLPQLPSNLSSLSLIDFVTIPPLDLPCNLQKIEIHNSQLLPLINSLPLGLKELELGNVLLDEKISIDDYLPENLERLSLIICENIILPKKLPSNLQYILLSSMKEIKWDIKPENIPKGLDITTDLVKISHELLKREDIKFSGKSTGEASLFTEGDVVYGLTGERVRITSLLKSIYDITNKDIIIQNSLTNAVWNPRVKDKYNSDEFIRHSLNDYSRGEDFKKFLTNHKNYNVTDERFFDLSKEDLWMKTSKAGLEFQTKIRHRNVIFTLDTLFNSIDEIAGKEGKHGDAITAHELRWIYRHRNNEDVKENVKFFLHGEAISHEDVFSLPAWERYNPKNSHE